MFQPVDQCRFLKIYAACIFGMDEMMKQLLRTCKSPTLLHHRLYTEAKANPGKLALIDYQSGKQWMYKQLASQVEYTAMQLINMGVEQGDRIVVSFPLSVEFVSLLYASFQVGAIFSPLSPEMELEDLADRINEIQPKAAFVKGYNLQYGFVKANCPGLKKIIQVRWSEDRGMKRQVGFGKGLYDLSLGRKRFYKRISKVEKELHKWSPVTLLYDTDGKGIERPAIYCHENILLQKELIQKSTDLSKGRRILVNSPTHKVSGLIQSLLSCLDSGNTAVLIPHFRPATTLTAIQQHKITHLIQTPLQFEELWEWPTFSAYDLKSLQFGIYLPGHKQPGFLERLKQFVPGFGTGLWLTESAGFVTFSQIEEDLQALPKQSSERSTENLTQLSIRRSMGPDGKAGEEIPDGKVGQVCLETPNIFLGYYQQSLATSKILSKEGLLYTGKTGYIIPKNGKRVLHLFQN